MADYPELNGLPTECTDSSYVYDELVVRVPYKGVDETVVKVTPIGSGYEDLYLQIHKETPEEEYIALKGFGYDSPREESLRTSLRSRASALAQNSAFYHPSAKAKIVELASAAKELLNGINDLYREHRDNYPVILRDSQMEMRFGLDQDDYITAQTAVSGEDYYPRRAADRAAIREAYEKASRFLWCAQLGKAQSESLRENTRIYNERNPSTPSRPGFVPPASPSRPPVIDASRFGIGVQPGGTTPGGREPPAFGAPPETPPGGPPPVLPGVGTGEAPPTDPTGSPCDPESPPPPGYECMMVAPGTYQLIPSDVGEQMPGEPPPTDVTGTPCDPDMPPPAGFTCVEMQAGQFVLMPTSGEGISAPVKRKSGVGAGAILLGLGLLIVAGKK